MTGGLQEPYVSPGVVVPYSLVQCPGNCGNRTAENRAAGCAQEGQSRAGLGILGESLPVKESSMYKGPEAIMSGAK